MEIVVKIQTENIDVQRELVCDLCNKTLVSEDHREPCMYAMFWKDRDSIYLEKYICERCIQFWKKKKIISFESAPTPLKKALEEDFKRDWHGIIAGLSDEEWKMLQNPLLLKAYLYTYGRRF